MTPIQGSFFYTPESIVFPAVYVIILRKSVFFRIRPIYLLARLRNEQKWKHTISRIYFVLSFTNEHDELCTVKFTNCFDGIIEEIKNYY